MEGTERQGINTPCVLCNSLIRGYQVAREDKIRDRSANVIALPHMTITSYRAGYAHNKCKKLERYKFI